METQRKYIDLYLMLSLMAAAAFMCIPVCAVAFRLCQV